MFGPQRHENLAAALPVPPDGAVVDLGCGDGRTLAALDRRLDATSRLVGVDAKESDLAVERAELVIADLDRPLPFPAASFDAAVCQNVIECLRDHQAYLTEVARILKPGGHLLLGHSDYDTLVFSASDLGLTRQLVHRFCDTVQPWMTVADGTVGRRLVALGRRSPLELVGSFDGWAITPVWRSADPPIRLRYWWPDAAAGIPTWPPISQVGSWTSSVRLGPASSSIP